MRPDRRTLEQLTTELVASVPADVADDLRHKDAATAIELHFPPVKTRAFDTDVLNGDCSTDGYYCTDLTPGTPWILYSDLAAPPRVRFTLIHELGHHLMATSSAHLLDDLDRLAGSAAAAMAAEETLCHSFAGRLLLPDDLVTTVVGSDPITPATVQGLKEATNASWAATAVRLTMLATEPMAIAFVRRPGEIDFCAASPRLGWGWWPRWSAVDPQGALAYALAHDNRARPDIYRWELTNQRRMFCDTIQIHENLAVAVLTDKPSDGHFEILEQPDAVWKERVEFCEFCDAERAWGWCATCRGRLCSECGRCGCTRPIQNPVCPACHLRRPATKGSELCVDCRADLE